MKNSLLGGLEPPTFRLTAERASQLRHKSWFSCELCRSNSDNNIFYSSHLLQQCEFKIIKYKISSCKNFNEKFAPGWARTTNHRLTAESASQLRHKS